MKYDILLFDADNTVLDFDKSEEQALFKAFKECGLNLDKSVLNVYRKNNIAQWRLFEAGKIDKNRVLRARFEETFKELNLNADIDRISELYEQYLHYGFFVIDYAETVLCELQKHCRLYLVSNGVESIQNSRMKGSGLDKYFLKRFVSEAVGFPKPRIEFFDYCFGKIPDFKKEKTLIIGDSLTSDIQGGVNAGIDTCWFNPHKESNFLNLTPTYEIRDLRKLPYIVE